MSTLEAGIVVELDVRGQTQGLPARLQAVDDLDCTDHRRGHASTVRPCSEVAVSTDTSGPCCNLRSSITSKLSSSAVPAATPAGASPAVGPVAARGDGHPSVHGGGGCDQSLAPTAQVPPRHATPGQSHGPELTQHAVLTQRTPRVEHLPFHWRCGPVQGRRGPRCGLEVNAIQSLAVAALDPRPHRPETHPKPLRYRAQGRPVSNQLHHVTPPTSNAELTHGNLIIEKSRYGIEVSAIADHWLFRIC